MSAPDMARIEEAALNALQTQRQMFYDGWLLRLSPGSAKRARSVNPHFGSTRPLDEKITHCERVYAARDLPVLLRITPFRKPSDLEQALDARGYVAFDRTLVQTSALDRPPEVDGAAVELSVPPMRDFVEAVGELRGSTRAQRDAHLERLAYTPLTTHAVLARMDDRPVAAGQVALDAGLAGVYDVVTAEHARGRGVGTSVVARLLTWAWEHGASHAYLQVTGDNASALAVYRKFGFTTAYEYHYRAPTGECR
jgi:ribosomal protein S18 acetylase RimI-like enzyme